ncbi:TetR family transcriptional regulator [Actinomycetospora endophytica]|uniref:TetR family transcriptional regulator n=1 Tax=Actinomycetospora endophytica TaxID=2291215 RepID=A0ABS8PAU4_9PSEU|nr:TetR family transcriptional regulator [Actinomycetospora endophytica]MCD2195052.1 TetR family transcriptional regulator [Actinomycetospora endophytica]
MREAPWDTAGRPAVRADPSRRERIARAAISVVAERGVDGLTHRAVAAAADVPLGSTTYHFQTLDDLLEEALRHAADDNIGAIRAWESGLAPDGAFAEAMTDLVMGYVGENRSHTVVEYDLYIAALHRPALRPVSAAWDNALVEVFGRRTDPLTGRVLAGLFCGLLMQSAMADPPPSAEAIREVFRRAIEGPHTAA